jgi:hypothetical protein
MVRLLVSGRLIGVGSAAVVGSVGSKGLFNLVGFVADDCLAIDHRRRKGNPWVVLFDLLQNRATICFVETVHIDDFDIVVISFQQFLSGLAMAAGAQRKQLDPVKCHFHSLHRHTQWSEDLLITIEDPMFQIVGFADLFTLQFHRRSPEHAEAKLKKDQSASDFKAGQFDLQLHQQVVTEPQKDQQNDGAGQDDHRCQQPFEALLATFRRLNPQRDLFHWIDNCHQDDGKVRYQTPVNVDNLQLFLDQPLETNF